MRAILSILWSEQTAPSVLDLSARMARRFGGHVTGLAIRPAFESFVPSGDFGLALSQDYLDRVQKQGAERIERLQQQFDHTMRANGDVPHSWREDEGPSATTIGMVGRVFDLAVIARPDQGGSAEPEVMLEAALFETGRPVLVAPPSLPPATDQAKGDGRRILIAWNGSSETARTIALGMPLLQGAEEIHIVQVDSAWVPGPHSRDVAGYLARNGLSVTSVAEVKAGDRNPGEAMLAEATARGCDLMIKGAYTQSRLRQMIFGGATNHILGNLQIPVFFAH